MEIKHTPPPWEFQKACYGLTCDQHHIGTIFNGADHGDKNYDIFVNHGKKGDPYYDACLAIAAPIMLEALKNSLFGLELRLKREPKHKGLAADIKIIRKAIATAEGKI